MENQETLADLAMSILADGRHRVNNNSEAGQKLAALLLHSMGIEYDQGCGENCPKCKEAANKAEDIPAANDYGKRNGGYEMPPHNCWTPKDKPSA